MATDKAANRGANNSVNKKNPKKGTAPSAKKDSQWTDDEAELLLNVSYDYKTMKAGENTDWESVKSKYEDILERFKAKLPDEPHKKMI